MPSTRSAYCSRGLRRHHRHHGATVRPGANWEGLVGLVGLDTVLDDARKRFPGVQFLAEDYRLTRAQVTAGSPILLESRDAGDDYEELDLGTRSLLMPLMAGCCNSGLHSTLGADLLGAHGPTSKSLLGAPGLLER